ncbi:MAG: ribonuclease III [Candidatus Caldarchaeum sp.]
MLEKRLGYKFKDQNILRTALTHSSFANEANVESNERLEFLGDAVVGFIVARILYDEFPGEQEGVLSKMRGAIVSRANMARLARELGIDEALMLGKGEEQTGGRRKESNLSGAFEAVMGAVYLDGGIRGVERLVKRLIKDSLTGGEIFADYKTRLQETAQREFKCIPRYRVIREEGPPHDKWFFVEVRIGSDSIGLGKGKNKKQAEQLAAREGLRRLIGMKEDKEGAHWGKNPGV